MVYLIHLAIPFKGVRHYIGYTENLEERLKKHRSGYGSRLLRAVVKAGIDFEVVRIWEDKDGNFERKLKKQKNSKRYCPICGDGSKELKHG